MAAGTIGYLAFGYGPLDAVYQTVNTVTTVGYREVHPFGRGEKVFTIVLALLGVGTALYTFGVLLDTLVEGRISETVGRRRMERTIAAMQGHVVVCGWGRVGRTVSAHLAGNGRDVVVVDRDPERLTDVPYPTVLGDASDDAVLRKAGLDRASVLAAALDTDAGNLFITVSARALKPDLFIVARARVAAAVPKLTAAGADRVVNPQEIGGARMAAFALQPHVAEFLDVVMHDGSLEFRLEEVQVPADSPVAGQSLRDSQLRDRTGALILALRDEQGRFTPKPDPNIELRPGDVLIAIGTADELAALSRLLHR